jgi:hypothetical protein
LLHGAEEWVVPDQSATSGKCFMLPHNMVKKKKWKREQAHSVERKVKRELDAS